MQDARAPAPARPAPWLVAGALLTLLKVWLVAAQTVYPVSPMPGDDDLFFTNAAWLLRGEWLGPMADVTLVKGPVYPIWLALTAWLGVRLLLAQAVLYALACATLAVALRPVLGVRARFLVFAAVLFTPASWADGPATRLLREGIYPALTLLVLALAVGAALRLRDAASGARWWAAAAGLAGALLTMTREDGAWLAPSVGMVGLLGLLGARRSGWRRFVSAGVLAGVAFAVPTIAVATINRARYGVFETCEATAEYYTAAYGSLARVRTRSWNPFVPVPREARSRIAEVSPTYREVAADIEASAPGWIKYGCAQMNVCDDIAGGWFSWAFRHAVDGAGKYETAATARAWYEQLTREIDEACRDGRLQCTAARSSPLPPWQWDYLRPLLRATAHGAKFLATFDEVTSYPSPPAANADAVARYEVMTHERIPRAVIAVVGELSAPSALARAAVIDGAGRPARASVRTTSEGALTRVSVETGCVMDCKLVVLDKDDHVAIVPLDGQAATGNDVIRWRTESFRKRREPDLAALDRARLAVLEAITSLYSIAVPALLLAAVALLVARLARRGRAVAADPVLLVALVFAVAVATRVALLALIEVTSFRGFTVEYCSPAYAPLVAAVVLAFFTGRIPATGRVAWEAPPPATP